MKKLAIQFVLIVLGILSVVIANFVSGILIKDFSLISALAGVTNGSFTLLLTFLVIWVVVLGLEVGGVYFYLRRKGLAEKVLETKKDTLATANFSTEKDFKGIAGKDGLVISKKFRLSEKKSFEHFVLVGPTGSGKSVSFFIPNLLELPAHASVVVSDPKGELFAKTARHALAQGKNVIAFSPFKSKTMKYNPLALCRNISEIRELAQILLANGNAAIEQMTGTKSGGSEWTNMATPLLVAFLIFVRNLDAPDNTVHKALELITENDLDTLKILIEDTEPEAQAQFNIFLQSAESEKTASSIKTVLATSLQMFTDPLIQKITSLNEIDPKALRKHPTHLYVMVPEHKSSFMSPLMSPFYSQLLNHLIEDGNGAPVYFLLDEFANIGMIPNIDVIAATCRSRGMSLSLGIQSVNQLKQKYGEAAESLIENLKTKACLPGLSTASSTFFSQMVGHKEIETTTTSYGKGSDTSYSTSKQKRELLSPDEIRRLPDGKMLIITDNRNPVIHDQFRYYEDKRLSALTNKELSVEEFLQD